MALWSWNLRVHRLKSESHMLNCVLFSSALLTLFLGLNCKKDEPPCTTSPPPQPTNCEYPTGNRNFTWRTDTVAWFPSTLGGVWAFSDSDAYVMGYIVDGTPPYTLRLGRHWNGHVWENNINGTFSEINHYANDVTGDDFYMATVGYWAIGNEKVGIGEFDNRTKRWRGYQFQTQGELRSVWTDGNGYFIAVGDNGMVYTKDGYNAGWVYSQVPTSFNFSKVTGTSKNEIYARAGLNLRSGEHYQQYWRYDGTNWLKLYDDQDTTGTPIKLEGTENTMIDVAAIRCSITDSLKLYLIGWESFLLETKGQSLDYRITNLTDLGLPLRALERTAFLITLFTPNDIWIFGTRYNFYHWNGSNFRWMVIPGLPNDNTSFGIQKKMSITASGKIYLPSEVSSQVYVIVQGTP